MFGNIEHDTSYLAVKSSPGSLSVNDGLIASHIWGLFVVSFGESDQIETQNHEKNGKIDKNERLQFIQISNYSLITSFVITNKLYLSDCH